MSLKASRDFIVIELPWHGPRIGFEEGLRLAEMHIKPAMKRIVQGKAKVGIVIPMARQKYESPRERLNEGLGNFSITSGFFVGLLEELISNIRAKDFPGLETGIKRDRSRHIPQKETKREMSNDMWENWAATQSLVKNWVALKGVFEEMREANDELDCAIFDSIKLGIMNDDDEYRFAEFNYRRQPERLDLTFDEHASLYGWSVVYLKAIDAMYVKNLNMRQEYRKNGEAAMEYRIFTYPEPRAF